MAHQHTPSSFVAPRLVRILAIVGLTALTTAADCLALLDDEDPPTCPANCAVEDTCGLRSQAECLAAFCDGAEVKPEMRALDTCLGAATDDCLEAAACACEGGCAQTEACGASPDPTCVGTCDTLVDQDPEGTYRENACRIESSCEGQAVCSSVGA